MTSVLTLKVGKFLKVVKLLLPVKTSVTESPYKSNLFFNFNICIKIALANAKKTKLFDRCRISTGSFASFLKNAAGKESFDLIFLDPPYALGYIPEALSLIAEGDLLRAGGRIVCESDNGTAPVKKKDIKSDEYHNAKVMEQVFGGNEELFEKYTVVKTALYGRSRITLLEMRKEDEE